jgi:hypothetical protein
MQRILLDFDPALNADMCWADNRMLSKTWQTANVKAENGPCNGMMQAIFAAERGLRRWEFSAEVPMKVHRYIAQ